jgi:TonB family protein
VQRQRFNQRQGFLVSLTLHLIIIMILFMSPQGLRRADEIDPSTLERKNLVYLPPAAEIRKMLPPQARRPAPAPTPVPAPTPPPANQKNRISIGPPSDVRQKELILRREDDLTKVPKGERSPTPPQPTPPPPMPTPLPTPVATAQSSAPEKVDEKTGREGLKLPPGLTGQTPSGQEARKPVVGPIGPSISRAMDGVTQRAMRESRTGIPNGTGQQMGALFFDPQGADFTLWINRFKDEVYRNWNIPEAANLGAARGHVDFEFVRDGTMSSLRMLKSSGTNSLDRAAEFALRGSRLLPLPDDYGPARVTMQVSFHYNDYPQQGS